MKVVRPGLAQRGVEPGTERQLLAWRGHDGKNGKRQRAEDATDTLATISRNPRALLPVHRTADDVMRAKPGGHLTPLATP
jgi:hypothetical protein